MSWYHKGEGDLCVLPSHHSPQQVLDHGGILVLSTTVVSVQVYCFLAQPMVHKEMVEHTDDGIGALPHVYSLVNQVVHLMGDGLTTHTKDCALTGYQEVHWAGLKRIVGVEHLLCHVKTVVGRDRCGVGWLLRCWWWWKEGVVCGEVGND